MKKAEAGYRHRLVMGAARLNPVIQAMRGEVKRNPYAMRAP
jgi:hypothetical protein